MDRQALFRLLALKWCLGGASLDLLPDDFSLEPKFLPARHLTDPGRHRISRSFKARKKPDPEIVTRTVINGETLVFATDGFWAELNDTSQAHLLEAESSDPAHVDDDVTWIYVQPQPQS